MGWFRDDGGPAFYGYSNRTSVTGDIDMIRCCLFFVTIYLAFLIIFPGVRKQRFTTFVIVTLTLFIGNVILIAKLGSSWHVGHIQINSVYCSQSKELVNADVGVYIGLNHVNVTLKAVPHDNSSTVDDINYNERFDWDGVHEMEEHYHDALVRGLPYPILTIAEYFSLNQEGFIWGSEYRAGGYYANIILWAALAAWFMMNLLMIVVPRYGAYALIITSFLLLVTCFIYKCMLPANRLIIRFEQNTQLHFTFGWCFWLTLLAGLASGLVGVVIAVMDILEPNRFSTILEVDYDTPYDRHIIIEDSHYHSKKRANKGNDDALGFGRRFLRRLSSKKDEVEEKVTRMGRDNRGFELERPNSPWRFAYHHRSSAIKDLSFKRTLSQDSSVSVASSSATVTFADQPQTQPTTHQILQKKSPLSRAGHVQDSIRLTTTPTQLAISHPNTELPVSQAITMW